MSAHTQGHKIKNPATAVAKSVRAVPARYRLLLTGTPVQNSLEELWALVDYVTTGNLLGPRPAFKRAYADSILRARDRHATDEERALGHERARALMALIAPHLLRREKETLLIPTAAGSATSSLAGVDGDVGLLPSDAKPLTGSDHSITPASLLALAASARPATGVAQTAMGTMGRKVEVALWAPTSGVQLRLYKLFLGSRTVVDAIRELSAGGGGFAGAAASPLAAITTLRKIACHPALLGRDVAARLLLAGRTQLEGAGSDVCPDGDGSDRMSDYERAAEREWLQATINTILASPAPAAPPYNDVPLASDDDDDGDDDMNAARVEARSDAARIGTAPKAWRPDQLPSAATLVNLCPKLRLLAAVVRRDVAAGHRVLVFSQWKRMLDILEPVMKSLWEAPWLHPTQQSSNDTEISCAPNGVPVTADGCGVPFLRIDGDVAAAERGGIVARFNSQAARFGVCLLTTGVGSLGLTLTGADRVIIYDGAWNPAVDAQAVDRAYRVGQTRDVLTYRIIGCGAVEEKMYRLQVHKGGLATSVMNSAAAATASNSQMTGNSSGSAASADAGWNSGRRGGSKWAARLLTRKDYKELFTLGSTRESDTRALLLAHGLAPPRVPSAALAQDLASLSSDGAISQACVGISHHDSLFRLTESASDASRNEDEAQASLRDTSVASSSVPPPLDALRHVIVSNRRPVVGPLPLPRPSGRQTVALRPSDDTVVLAADLTGSQSPSDMSHGDVDGGPRAASGQEGSRQATINSTFLASKATPKSGFDTASMGDDDSDGISPSGTGTKSDGAPTMSPPLPSEHDCLPDANATTEATATLDAAAATTYAAMTRLDAALAALEHGGTAATEQVQLDALESADELGWLAL